MIYSVAGMIEKRIAGCIGEKQDKMRMLFCQASISSQIICSILFNEKKSYCLI